MSDQQSITRAGNPAKPHGEAGAEMLARMNESHAPVTAWALSHAHPAPDAAVLDIGCGGGATLRRLAELVPQGTLVGLDYSPLSVAETRYYNRDLVTAGVLQVMESSVEDIPFAPASFDLITTVESFYFWPAPQDNLREVRRVLRPGGTFLLVADIYDKPGLPEQALRNIEEYKLFNPSLLRLGGMLHRAGFRGIVLHTKPGTDWVCAEAHA